MKTKCPENAYPEKRNQADLLLTVMVLVVDGDREREGLETVLSIGVGVGRSCNNK